MSIGIVAIGRNEGERLRVCLESCLRSAEDVVYVDSGSSDGSCELARSLSVHVVELDTDRPFSAARARNAGFEFMRAQRPDLDFVQFVDGDCELDSDWIEAASVAMLDSGLAVVCGRRRERFPERSIYNRLCDMEWDTAVGQAEACGGDSLIREAAFSAVGGFDDAVVAGEEPDLCLRLRQQGWQIRRLDAEMTLHDADMMRFSQWWTRMLRAGHAYAEGVDRHGVKEHAHYGRNLRSSVFWGGALPVLSLGLWPFSSWALWLWLAGWGALTLRIYRSGVKPGFSPGARFSYALSSTVGKLPSFLGVALYSIRKLLARPSHPIEYKDSTSN